MFLLIETKSKKRSDRIINPSVIASFFASDNRDKCEERILIKPCKVVLSRCKLPESPSDRNQPRNVFSSCEVNDNPCLRRSQRKIQAKIVPKPDRPKDKTSQVSNLITPAQMTNNLWRSMVVRGWDIKIGMLVCAKMSTYWPWPAQVIRLFRKKARVKFFGDFREGSVDITACIPFYDCQAIVLNYVNIIDEKTKSEFKHNVIDNIEKPRNNFYKKVSLKHLYLQAIRDLELYARKEESFILSIL